MTLIDNEMVEILFVFCCAAVVDAFYTSFYTSFDTSFDTSSFYNMLKAYMKVIKCIIK